MLANLTRYQPRMQHDLTPEVNSRQTTDTPQALISNYSVAFINQIIVYCNHFQAITVFCCYE